MKLRKLEPKDAPLMLEWMHDSRVTRFFRYDFKSKTLKDAESFIEEAKKEYETGSNYHFAVCDSNDTYLGTISLKNVDSEKKDAEYAISLRHCAQGKGAGTFATKAGLDFAFNSLNLSSVYLNVLDNNAAAIHLYEKCGFVLERTEQNALVIEGKAYNLRWYRANNKG